MRLVRALLGVVAASLVLGVAVTAGGASKLPTPGNAKQVSAVVAASPSINSIPPALLPSLSQVPDDQSGLYYGSASRACTAFKCEWGDLRSRKLVVLYGDSHAQMWLPAFVPIAKQLGLKLALVWHPGCPAADVSVWEESIHAINGSCNTFRKDAIHAIIKARPYLVITADRTSDIPGAGNKLMSAATWKFGLERTLAAFTKAKVRVAVIGDIVAFDAKDPEPQCLAVNPTDVQHCSVPNPNPGTINEFAAEQAAAAAEGVTYLDPQPWLCTPKVGSTRGTCSPIVGTPSDGYFAVYYDDFHVTATYAEYLSAVWEHLLLKDGLVRSP